MIRDIGHEVGIAAIGSAHDAILIIAVNRGSEPQCAILLVGVAHLDEMGDGLVNEVVCVKRGLKVTNIELNVGRLEIELLFKAQRCHGKFLYCIGIIAGWILRKFKRLTPGDFRRACQQLRSRQRGDDGRCNIARLRCQFPGELQRNVDGEVSVIQILWFLNLDDERHGLVFESRIGDEQGFLEECRDGTFVVDEGWCA